MVLRLYFPRDEDTGRASLFWRRDDGYEVWYSDLEQADASSVALPLALEQITFPGDSWVVSEFRERVDGRGRLLLLHTASAKPMQQLVVGCHSLLVAEAMEAQLVAKAGQATSAAAEQAAAAVPAAPTGCAAEGGQAVHFGVSCDKSGMCPIVGPRYKLKGQNYDLCEAEYNQLPPAERANFLKIEAPRPPGSDDGGESDDGEGPPAWCASRRSFDPSWPFHGRSMAVPWPFHGRCAAVP